MEDEEEQLESQKLLFDAEGFHFIGARSGIAALELFRTQQISAVVLDYWMSEMNGLAIAEEMKRENPAVPIVILSGFGPLPGEGAGLVDEWFQKGRTEPEVLIERIRTLIDRKIERTVK